MQYDPILAALIKERGPSHPEYRSILLQEKVIALALEGKVQLGQPRDAVLDQLRDVIRQEREARAAGSASAGDPAAIIAAHSERARLEMREDPVERLQHGLAKASGRPAHKPMKPKKLRAGRHLEPEAIIDEICRLRRIERRELLGSSRRRDRVRVRFELLYRLRVEAGLSCKAIGPLVGNRHHTTVSHGVREWCRLNGLAYPDGEDNARAVPAPSHQGFCRAAA
jgi:hypothetical protein